MTRPIFLTFAIGAVCLASARAEDPTTLIEPFDPPPFSEIDAKADWQPMPVRDSLKDLAKHLESRPAPLTDADATVLRNNSVDDNRNILFSLGRQPKSPNEVSWNGTFNRRLGAEVARLNPILINSTSEFDVSGYLNAGLFSFDWDMSPFAAAETVEKWESSKDRMMDKVILRKDLTWSDGTPFTAHDVDFTYHVIMDPRVQVPAVRSGTDELRYVHAYDDHTLIYFHKKSLATNVWNVNFPIMPKHVYQGYEEDTTLAKSAKHQKLEIKPVCNGPYEVAERNRGGEILLKRRESFYIHEGKQVRGKPYFETIRFRVITDTNTALLALKSAEVDETNLSPDQWVRSTNDDEYYKRNTKVRDPEWVYFQINWNVKKPMFNDVRVRKALAFAMDYDELLKQLAYGLYEPCAGPFHSSAWMAPKPFPKPYEQDLDKAEELLDEAGWEVGDDGFRQKDGKKFEFALMYRSDPLVERYCKVVQQSFDQVGVVCNLRPIEFTVLQQRLLDHDFEAAFGGWGTGADPDTSKNIFVTKEGRNFGEYSNPEVDKLYEEAAAEFDRTKRAALYGKIHNIIYEDQPYLFLYWRAAFYGFNKNLRGYFMSPRGPYNFGPGSSAIWKVAE